jgi:hypothetical protein
MSLRAAVRRFARLARGAAGLPLRELLLILYAALVLLVVELLIRWVPLPRLTRMLGVRLDLSPAPVAQAEPAVFDLPHNAQLRLRNTTRVVDRWPFCKGPCLRRSLVTAHLLRAYDPAIRLGTAGTGDTLRAHAWVEIDDRPLEDVTEFAVLQVPYQGSPTRDG